MTTSKEDPSEDFLLAVHEHLGESFLRNEEVGDRRVTFFITLTTFVIGGLAVVAVQEGIRASDDQLNPGALLVIASGLLALLLFGFTTLERILKRNMDTDRAIRALNDIRRHFVKRDAPIAPLLREYNPYKKKEPRSEGIRIWSLGTGGLLQTVALMNSFVVAAIPVLWGFSLFEWFDSRTSSSELSVIYGLLGASAVALGGSTWAAHMCYARRRYRKEEGKVRGKEIEAALAISSENPAAVATEIKRLTSIADHQLVPQKPQAIHDVYFDTPDCALQTQKLALRVRQIGAARRIALKGPSRSPDSDFVERVEIEEPWSKDALDSIADELLLQGITLPQPNEGTDYGDPLGVMPILGLEVVQRRETQRSVSNVVRSRRKCTPVLAELVIDRVEYHFADRSVRHYEVEIEAKTDDGSKVVKTVIKRLPKMYKRELRRWNWGKLVTGKAVEELLSDGVLEGLLDVDRNLRPPAYDKIREFLEGGRL
jgi:hypothetical protein